MLRRMCWNAPSLSPPCRRIAPQQPASAATSDWMPAASSTRAVDVGHHRQLHAAHEQQHLARMLALRPEMRGGWRGRRHFCLEDRGQHAANELAGLQRRREERRGETFFQCLAQHAFAGRAWHLRIDDAPADVDEVAVLHARRAGRLVVAAGQAAVEMHLRRSRRRLALAIEHLLDQVDAAARPVELVAEQLIGVVQVAVQKPQCAHLRRIASASSPSALPANSGAMAVCMRGDRIGSKAGVEPARIEDARGIERSLQPLVNGAQRRRERRECAGRLVATAKEHGVAADCRSGREMRRLEGEALPCPANCASSATTLMPAGAVTTSSVGSCSHGPSRTRVSSSSPAGVSP